MGISLSSQATLERHLATLCLPPTASGSDVKRAFRSLMRELHPDSTGSDRSRERLTAVISAYRDLTRSGLPGEIADDGSRRNGRLVDVLA